MARFLAYTSPARGHLYPIVATLLKLRQRGHEVHVRTLASEVLALRDIDLEAEGVDPAIEQVSLDTWKATTPQEGLAQAYRTFAARARYEVVDLQKAISTVAPGAIIVDITTAGAAAVAELSGLPWARSIPLFQFSSFPGVDPSRVTMVPFGLDPAGLEVLNEPRRTVGLAPLAGMDEAWRAPVHLYYTAEPLEGGHANPDSFRLVGPGLWEPATQVPAWLEELHGPVVVSVSSEYQNDDALIATALQALRDLDATIVVTTSAHDPTRFDVPPNARVTRYLPHAAILGKASLVVCHGGMGITQKALAAGIPLAIVPFGRDQFDVAERVSAVEAGTVVMPWELSPASLREAVRGAQSMADGATRVATAFAHSGGAASAADALESLVPHLALARG
jgi:MGT family glycosyltransferase